MKVVPYFCLLEDQLQAQVDLLTDQLHKKDGLIENLSICNERTQVMNNSVKSNQPSSS